MARRRLSTSVKGDRKEETLGFFALRKKEPHFSPVSTLFSRHGFLPLKGAFSRRCADAKRVSASYIF